MCTSEKDPHSLSPQSILDLVKDLSIGQRAADTLEQLSLFLHENIFPKIGFFSIEIYFLEQSLRNYTPTPSRTSGTDRKNVPQHIPADSQLIEEIHQSPHPLQISDAQASFECLGLTENSTHLLAPILDGSDLIGLLYFGSRDSCSFSPLYLGAIETLAAIIGSRLKSMNTILQLKESMRALEYSERLRTALYEISEQAHHAQNIGDLYANLHQIVGRLIHAKNFSIALVEDRRDGQYITFPYHADRMEPNLHNGEVKFDQDNLPITGYLLKTRQPLLLTPENFQLVHRENNLQQTGNQPHSWLGAPFYLDNLAGAVAVQSYEEVIYTEKDKELMAFVARHLGDALKRKRAVDDLKQAKDRAELAERNKSAFLANMSHEIRTPMNGIIGLTELVLKSDIAGHQRTYLEMVHSSAERLLKLINDILDFSKIEAGKLELNITPFGLRSTIADALEILAISAAKKNIAMHVRCEESIPDQLLGDADKLQQILVNLVGNAIKFTHQGNVTIVIRRVATQTENEKEIEVHFQVRDTGIGIPEEKISNVFKAFSQLGTTRDSNHPGTGLGLVIAAELVEMMGGKICVESNPGVGTTFYFSSRFPIASTLHAEGTALTSPPQPRPETQKIGSRSLHILLVEDEFINRTLAVSVLEREGWRVTVAENGVEALSLLENHSFDLVLMDIQMPEMNGYEATRSIRQKERGSRRHMPIIAMTAYAVKGDREKCLSAGMDGYVSKPIRPHGLLEEIEVVLRHQSFLCDAQGHD